MPLVEPSGGPSHLPVVDGGDQTIFKLDDPFASHLPVSAFISGGFSEDFKKMTVGRVDVTFEVGPVCFACVSECGVFHGVVVA